MENTPKTEECGVFLLDFFSIYPFKELEQLKIIDLGYKKANFRLYTLQRLIRRNLRKGTYEIEPVGSISIHSRKSQVLITQFLESH